MPRGRINRYGKGSIRFSAMHRLDEFRQDFARTLVQLLDELMGKAKGQP